MAAPQPPPGFGNWVLNVEEEDPGGAIGLPADAVALIQQALAEQPALPQGFEQLQQLPVAQLVAEPIAAVNIVRRQRKQKPKMGGRAIRRAADAEEQPNALLERLRQNAMQIGMDINPQLDAVLVQIATAGNAAYLMNPNQNLGDLVAEVGEQLGLSDDELTVLIQIALAQPQFAVGEGKMKRGKGMDAELFGGVAGVDEPSAAMREAQAKEASRRKGIQSAQAERRQQAVSELEQKRAAKSAATAAARHEASLPSWYRPFEAVTSTLGKLGEKLPGPVGTIFKGVNIAKDLTEKALEGSGKKEEFEDAAKAYMSYHPILKQTLEAERKFYDIDPSTMSKKDYAAMKKRVIESAKEAEHREENLWRIVELTKAAMEREQSKSNPSSPKPKGTPSSPTSPRSPVGRGRTRATPLERRVHEVNAMRDVVRQFYKELEEFRNQRVDLERRMPEMTPSEREAASEFIRDETGILMEDAGDLERQKNKVLHRLRRTDEAGVAADARRRRTAASAVPPPAPKPSTLRKEAARGRGQAKSKVAPAPTLSEEEKQKRLAEIAEEQKRLDTKLRGVEGNRRHVIRYRHELTPEEFEKGIDDLTYQTEHWNAMKEKLAEEERKLRGRGKAMKGRGTEAEYFTKRKAEGKSDAEARRLAKEDRKAYVEQSRKGFEVKDGVLFEATPESNPRAFQPGLKERAKVAREAERQAAREKDPFYKINKGLTAIADTAVKVAPYIGVPKVVTEGYKQFAPEGSEYYKGRGAHSNAIKDIRARYKHLPETQAFADAAQKALNIVKEKKLEAVSGAVAQGVSAVGSVAFAAIMPLLAPVTAALGAKSIANIKKAFEAAKDKKDIVDALDATLSEIDARDRFYRTRERKSEVRDVIPEASNPDAEVVVRKSPSADVSFRPEEEKRMAFPPMKPKKGKGKKKTGKGDEGEDAELAELFGMMDVADAPKEKGRSTNAAKMLISRKRAEEMVAAPKVTGTKRKADHAPATSSPLKREAARKEGKGKAATVTMKKRDFVAEHKKLISLLDKTAKEGKEQAKELKKVLGRKKKD